MEKIEIEEEVDEILKSENIDYKKSILLKEIEKRTPDNLHIKTFLCHHCGKVRTEIWIRRGYVEEKY